MNKKLTRRSLINSLFNAVKSFPDSRAGGNLRYRIQDAVSFAFSNFYIQQPSFLRHEKNLHANNYRKNLRKMFPKQLTCAQTCRDILDPIDPTCFDAAFDDVFRKLDRSGILRNTLRFSEEFGLIVGGDGVDYFHSEKNH